MKLRRVRPLHSIIRVPCNQNSLESATRFAAIRAGAATGSNRSSRIERERFVMVMRAEFDSTINQEWLGQSTVNHTDPARSYAEGVAYFRVIALVVVREIELPGRRS
jgi:hypothetical protein